jgi:hypothetical protein
VERCLACEADAAGTAKRFLSAARCDPSRRWVRLPPGEIHLFCFRSSLVSGTLVSDPGGQVPMRINKLYPISLFFLIFLGVGIYLISKEVIFSFTQASATARVVDKTVSHSGNPGNSSGRDEHFLVCEIRPDPAKKTYRGEVEINFVSWSLTKIGQEIDVRYERTNPTLMRLPRSIGNWPFGLFCLVVGVFGFLVVVKNLLWPRPVNVGHETPRTPLSL